MGFEPADETLGRYRLFARLGRGGMAEVHVARMVSAARVEKLVVIKRMLGHLADDPQFVTMFENEGRIAVQLDHPNVCQTYELDNVDGQLFLVMELVRGLPWATVVARLPADELSACRFMVGVITQACEGLYYAHHLTDADGKPTPVVHRDVSPGNLMITNEGAAKLLDFGVSKLLSDDRATRAGMIKGKLPYMSPEHIKGEPVDPRADIFSLGVVMWEALARRSLFERPSDLKIFKAIVDDPIPPLPQTPITQRLEVVVRKALAKDRNDRQATARQLADELRDALSDFGMPMTQAQIQRAMTEWLSAELTASHHDLAAAIARVRAQDKVAVRPATDETRTYIDMAGGRAPETVVGTLPGEEVDTEDEQPTRTPIPIRTPAAVAPTVLLELEPSDNASIPTAPRPVVVVPDEVPMPKRLVVPKGVIVDEEPTTHRPSGMALDEQRTTHRPSNAIAADEQRTTHRPAGPVAPIFDETEESSDVAEAHPTQPFRVSVTDAPALPAGHVPSTMQGLPPANRLPAPAAPSAMPAGAWQAQPVRPSQPDLQLTPAQVAAANNAKFWVIVLVMVSVAAGVIAAILSA